SGRPARHVVAIEEGRCRRRDQMRIGDEVLEAVRCQHFLDARSHLPALAVLVAGWRRPLVARAVRALGQPDSARGHAEVALVRLDCGTELEVDRLVAREERKIPVRRGAGEDFDVSVALEIAEGARDVTRDSSMQLPHPLVEFLPEMGELDDLVLALSGEMLPALRARALHVLA